MKKKKKIVGAPNHRRRTAARCYTTNEKRKEEERTGNGGDADGAVVVVRDAVRRGTRDCGSRCETGAGDDVDEDGEGGVIFRELDAPESLPETDEEAAGTAPSKCEWRCTGTWRANRSLIIVVSASLSRTPFGSARFPMEGGVTGSKARCCSGCGQSSGDQQDLQGWDVWGLKARENWTGCSQGQQARPLGTECLAATVQGYW